MKKAFTILLIAGFLATSCKTVGHRGTHVPPGQAKKITGSKSAKTYAPGQQKKIN
jgi:hypothetical protein